MPMFFWLVFIHTGYLFTSPLPFIHQDILENDDIKLDNMFIASLVSDIIKVSKPLFCFVEDQYNH